MRSRFFHSVLFYHAPDNDLILTSVGTVEDIIIAWTSLPPSSAVVAMRLCLITLNKLAKERREDKRQRCWETDFYPADSTRLATGTGTVVDHFQPLTNNGKGLQRGWASQRDVFADSSRKLHPTSSSYIQDAKSGTTILQRVDSIST